LPFGKLIRQLGDIRRDPPTQTFQMPKSRRENKGMNVKRRRKPIFFDGIYALIALAVIAWPLWILARYLTSRLGWFAVHPLASQTIGFFVLGWVALVIVSAVIASIRKREEQIEMADWGFVAFVIIITYIAVTLPLAQIYLQNPN
jgi:hypothetical protein